MKNASTLIAVLAFGTLVVSSCSKESESVTPDSLTTSASHNDTDNDGLLVFEQVGQGVQRLAPDSYDWQMGNNLTGLPQSIYGSTTLMTCVNHIITPSGHNIATWTGQAIPALGVAISHTDTWTDNLATPAKTYTTQSNITAEGAMSFKVTFKYKK